MPKYESPGCSTHNDIDRARKGYHYISFRFVAYRSARPSHVELTVLVHEGFLLQTLVNP